MKKLQLKKDVIERLDNKMKFVKAVVILLFTETQEEHFVPHVMGV